MQSTAIGAILSWWGRPAAALLSTAPSARRPRGAPRAHDPLVPLHRPTTRRRAACRAARAHQRQALGRPLLHAPPLAAPDARARRAADLGQRRHVADDPG